MVNLLNEEIRAIKHTIEYKKKCLTFELSSGVKYQLKQEIKELEGLLEDKLDSCSDG